MTRRRRLFPFFVAIRWIGLAHLCLWPLFGAGGLYAAIHFFLRSELSATLVYLLVLEVFLGPLLYTAALLPFTATMFVGIAAGVAVAARWGIRRGCALVLVGATSLGALMDVTKAYIDYFRNLELGTTARWVIPAHLLLLVVSPILFRYGRGLVAEVALIHKGGEG